MCNAAGHPPGCACGFGPPYPYAYPYDEIPSVTIDSSALPSLGELPGPLPEFLVGDLTLCAGKGPIGYEIDVAESTVDLVKLPEYRSMWTREEHEAFDREIAATKKTVDALRQRIEASEQQGREITQDDIKWLNSKTFATPAGYRSRHYRQSPPCIRHTIDIYESWWNPSNWRDTLRLLWAGLQFRGAGYLRRVMFEIEIARVTEYRQLLIARKNKKVMKRVRVIFAPVFPQLSGTRD